MAAETQTGFIIAGTRYEVPTIDQFTLDEAQVLYDYTGLTLEDFAVALGDQELDEDVARELEQKVKNPGFLRALLHISYQRANPRLSAQRVKETVGAADLIDNFVALNSGGAAEDDANPPSEESTKQPNESSTSSSVDSNETSGTDSTTSSAPQEDQQPATTTTGSDMSLASALASSEA